MRLAFFNLCLFLPCHDKSKDQNVKLVTITKQLYYCDKLGQMAGENGEAGGGDGGRKNYNCKTLPWKLII